MHFLNLVTGFDARLLLTSLVTGYLLIIVIVQNMQRNFAIH